MSGVTASATVPFERPQPKPAETPAAPVVTQETPAAPVVPAETVVPPAAPETPAAPAAPESQPETVDFSAILQPYQEEIAKSGSLSGDSLKSIAEKLGAPLDVVELTYEGMLSRQNKRNNELLSEAGGQETYNEMVKWASGSFSENDAMAFNEALTKGTKEQAVAAIRQLKQKFTAVNGSPTVEVQRAQSVPSPAPVAPKTAPAVPATTKPFGSFEELRLAQKDKRYGSDPVYTAEVYTRASISRFK